MSDEHSSDPFAPPAVSTEVCCIHCGEVYDSWQIEWRVMKNSHGVEQGFWCCPIAGCDGIGFGFDILPTDPNYEDEHGGWVHDDDEDELDEEFTDEELAIAEEEETLAFDGEDVAPARSHDVEIPWDDSDPPASQQQPPGEDWPFSMN